jgi:hypothetical protein
LRHLASELDEHYCVKDQVQELSGENPEIMCPEAEAGVLGTHPALGDRRESASVLIAWGNG